MNKQTHFLAILIIGALIVGSGYVGDRYSVEPIAQAQSSILDIYPTETLFESNRDFEATLQKEAINLLINELDLELQIYEASIIEVIIEQTSARIDVNLTTDSPMGKLTDLIHVFAIHDGKAIVTIFREPSLDFYEHAWKVSPVLLPRERLLFWQNLWEYENSEKIYIPNSEYKLPFTGNTSHYVYQDFSKHFDFSGEGWIARAARGGQALNQIDSYGAYYTRITHSDGTFGWYIHFQANTWFQGEQGSTYPVDQGACLAITGNTGQTTGPHLHFNVSTTSNNAPGCDISTGCNPPYWLVVSFMEGSLPPSGNTPLSQNSTQSCNNPDNTPPTLYFSELTPFQWYNTDRNISFSATDNPGGSGVHHLVWAWDNSIPTTQINGASGSTTLLAAPMPIESQHTLFVQACDFAENCTAVQSYGWFGYDITPPTGNPNINQGQTVNNINVPLFPNGQDTPSGVAQILVSNDAINFESLNYVSPILWSILGVNRDFNYVWVKVVDYAGNESDVYSLETCLDLYPAPPSSSSYRLWSAGPNSAGGYSSSSSYQLNQIVGQTPSGNLLTNAAYQLQSGFLGIWGASPSSFYYRPFVCGQSTDVYLPMIIR
ncbi:MAG: hypothetical protein Fur0022_13250 [Anaerolineales bacterium]